MKKCKEKKDEAHIYFPADVMKDLRMESVKERRSLSATVVIIVEKFFKECR